MAERRGNHHEIPPLSGVYDRKAAAGVLFQLARVAVPKDMSPYIKPIEPIEYTDQNMRLNKADGLTDLQRNYWQGYMPELPRKMLTSATNYTFWIDSEGNPAVGYYNNQSPLGPEVAIAAREMTIALTRALDNPCFQGVAATISDHDHQILQGTTTDKEPKELLRIGYVSAEKAIVQYAMLAHETPHDNPQSFVQAMADSKLFRAIANGYFWEQQASTHKRKFVAGHLETRRNGSIHFSRETQHLFNEMKRRTITDAMEIAHRAITNEGLTLDQAVDKYYAEQDEAAEQYMRLPEFEMTKCLAIMPQHVDGVKSKESIFDHFEQPLAETFTKIAAQLDITPVRTLSIGSKDITTQSGTRISELYCPDIFCHSCKNMIERVVLGKLEGVTTVSVDPESKRVLVEYNPKIVQRVTMESALDGNGFPVAK